MFRTCPVGFLAMWAGLGCGFDSSGLGADVDAVLWVTSSTGATLGSVERTSGDAHGTRGSGESDTMRMTSSTVDGTDGTGNPAESSDGAPTGGGESSGTGSTSVGEGTSGTSGTSDDASTDSGVGFGSSSVTGIETASGSTDTGGSSCAAVPHMVWATAAQTTGYVFEESSLLPELDGEPIRYARGEFEADTARTLLFESADACEGPLHVWGLVYVGAAVGGVHDVELMPADEGGDIQTERWDYACLSDDDDEPPWQWVPIVASGRACLDGDTPWRATQEEAYALRLSPATTDLSVIAAVAFAGDATFDPRTLYNPREQ